MNGDETRSTRAALESDSPVQAHAARFVPVLDSRNRKVPGLSQRGRRYYGQLWIEHAGKKTPRRFPLLTPEGAPVASLTEARDAFERLRHGRREEKLPPLGHKPTLAAYTEVYLKSGPFTKKKSGTQENERQALERWARHCGEVRIDRIKTAHVADFINRRLKGEIAPGKRAVKPAAERTVQLDVVALRNLLNAARDEGKLNELPRFPEIRPPAPLKKQTVAPTEVERLIALAPSACPKNGAQLSDYLRFLCASGAREQEALKVRWDAVDLENGRLTVGADGDTKNREARIIEINPTLHALLKDMKARRPPDSVWLFPSPRRGNVDRPAKTFRESLRLVRAATKMPGFGFHDCRRFFATMCIQSGIDIQTVSKWLGHKDGGILVAKTYADVLGDHRQRMAAKLNLGKAE